LYCAASDVSIDFLIRFLELFSGDDSLTVGTEVTWSGKHDLVPPGTIGKIIEIRDDGKVIVAFPKGNIPIPASHLTRVGPSEGHAARRRTVTMDL